MERPNKLTGMGVDPSQIQDAAYNPNGNSNTAIDLEAASGVLLKQGVPLSVLADQLKNDPDAWKNFVSQLSKEGPESVLYAAVGGEYLWPSDRLNSKGINANKSNY